MEPTKFFDAYSIRARLFPAVIAAAPALAAIALLVSWSTLGLSNAIASIGMLALMFAIADLSRARGRKLECRLYADHGGLPSITMFRRSDKTIDSGLKDRYRTFLAEQLGVQAPDAEVELLDKSAADGFYDQCGAWLRQNTRDSKRFSILFAENVTYGFRRNLLGVKTIALWLNAIVVGVCLLFLWRLGFDTAGPVGSRVGLVLIVAVAHAGYMLLAVTRGAVWDASQAYGRELILSCESFLAQPRDAR